MCDLHLYGETYNLSFEREVIFELCDKKKMPKSKVPKVSRGFNMLQKKNMEEMMVFSQQSVFSFSRKLHNL